MNDKKWPILPRDPSWLLEQIEMGFRKVGTPLQSPPAVPKLTHDEIESTVTRLLKEELARLDQDEAETETPGDEEPPGVEEEPKKPRP